MRAVLAAVAVFAGLASASARAECLSLAAGETIDPVTTAELQQIELGPTAADRRGRVVAPVFVNGEGPFRFIVDTGANRSVLSPELATRLGLTAYGESTVHTINGQALAPLVGVDSLRYGGLSLPGHEMPMLGGAVLAGEHGLLGADGLRDRRLRLDFEAGCIEISPSRGASPLRAGWTRMDGEIRFGHLLMVRGTIRNIPVNLLIDTGSDSSLANRALSDVLRARMRRPVLTAEDFHRAYTAGEVIVLDRSMLIPRMSLGEMQVNNLVAYVGDFHLFNLWNLQDEPTLLIGMDVISQSRGIAIDYGRSAVYFRLPRNARRQTVDMERLNETTDPFALDRRLRQ